MFPFTISWMQYEVQRDSLHFVPSLPWSRDFGLDAAALDGDHRVMLDCLNSVLYAIPSHDRQRMALAYNVLSAQAHRHFEREEANMTKAGFSGLGEHHDQHDELRRRLASLHFSLISSPSYFGSNAAFNSLSQWFVPHLVHGYKAFAQFMSAGKPDELRSESSPGLGAH